METPDQPTRTRHRRSPGARDADALAALVSERLQGLIGRENRSLKRLTELTGLDEDELRRIESGSEAPTIDRLWRIANALGVPFGSLVASKQRQGVRIVRRSALRSISSSEGRFVSRPLFAFDGQRPVEFYEITIGPGHLEHAEAHAPGTKENVIVAKGAVEIVVGREPAVQLDEGDAADFLADVPHSYRNLGVVPAIIYLVMSYETGFGACA
ncbi:helix-turn-helix domain-containing protein [Methylocystis heyeri]|uniref:Cupin domain-containing protein n=1 Tax=Methylocystis heyeri TaxID=391905 RepID=A0A6B8KBH0_9HYPH|nr:XRE family transcriptional regulator [Methylocystis heyeri]QGM44405.1 cupin domain-containing protein [Methylocystis heyeri]